MKFLELFNHIEKGSHGFTDEAIYAAINNGDGVIPMYGGNNQHSTTDRYVSPSTQTVDGNTVKVFSGEGIIISLDGSAGSMTYKNGETFTLNHHAGFMTLTDEGKKKVNLVFFSYFMQSHYKSLSVSDGTKTLSLGQIYSDNFDLPDIKVQDRVIRRLLPVLDKTNQLSIVNERLQELLDKDYWGAYSTYQAKEVKISTCIGYISGNSGLTEEFLYNNIELPGERYRILSSATQEDNMLGEIPKCKIAGRELKVFEDKEGLLVIRKGKAGTTQFLKPGKYTLNDDAYILYVKEDCPYEIDLKWLAIQYKMEFLNYSSSSDNGTWNMTGFFKNVVIDIPSIEEQKSLVEMFDRAEIYKDKINLIQAKIQNLLNKEIQV